MSTSMPWMLLLSWAVFFGFLSIHWRRADRIRGGSRSHLTALKTSAILGALTGIILLSYYATRVAWYWPPILFVLGSLAGGFLFSALDVVIGKAMSGFAFLGWPAGAVWFAFIVQVFHH